MKRSFSFDEKRLFRVYRLIITFHTIRNVIIKAATVSIEQLIVLMDATNVIINRFNVIINLIVH